MIHFKFDVFVHPLAQQLRGDELRVWLDVVEILPGDSIPIRIEEGPEHTGVGGERLGMFVCRPCERWSRISNAKAICMFTLYVALTPAKISPAMKPPRLTTLLSSDLQGQILATPEAPQKAGREGKIGDCATSGLVEALAPLPFALEWLIVRFRNQSGDLRGN